MAIGVLFTAILGRLSGPAAGIVAVAALAGSAYLGVQVVGARSEARKAVSARDAALVEASAARAELAELLTAHERKALEVTRELAAAAERIRLDDEQRRTAERAEADQLQARADSAAVAADRLRRAARAAESAAAAGGRDNHPAGPGLAAGSPAAGKACPVSADMLSSVVDHAGPVVEFADRAAAAAAACASRHAALKAQLDELRTATEQRP
jgi:hypothetical protein